MTAKTGWLVAGLCAGCLAAPAPGDGPEPRRFEFAQTHMGCRFQIVLYSTDEAAARRASDAAFARVAELDGILSDYQPESELMRLCGKAGGPPVPVGADLFAVLDQSRIAFERSDGAFDVTVAPVVRLWRRARRTRTLPDPERIARARELVGFGNVTLDPKARTVQLLKPGMKLDLGGIAKGYAADEAVAVLKRLGHPRCLVAASGDIVVGDPPPGRAGWSVGIAALEHPDGAPERTLLLRHAAISTAGDAEQFVEIGGVRYAHIIDPRTGLGVVGHGSVTVIAPDGATADSLDTAAYILGPERGLALIEATPGAAALIQRATKSGVERIESRRFKDLPVASRPVGGTSAQSKGRETR